MKNLAGDKNCDQDIRNELTLSGIEIVEAAEPCGREVNARLTGKLGKFKFRRAWYYWTVEGPMPLDVAQKLYGTNPTDVRVAGMSGGDLPENWAKSGFVRSYNIDTQEGLNVFAEAVRGL